MAGPQVDEASEDRTLSVFNKNKVVCENSTEREREAVCDSDRTNNERAIRESDSLSRGRGKYRYQRRKRGMESQ